MKVLEQTSKLSLLISFVCSWTTESGYMKIKLCQGLWPVSLDKCLMEIENRVPSAAPHAGVHCRRLWASSKGLRIILPEKYLLGTGKFFQRMTPPPSLFW